MSIERRYALLKHNHLHSENTGGLITLTTGSPTIRFYESDASTGNRTSDLSADGEDIKWRLTNDDASVGVDFLVLNRTLNNADALRLRVDILHLDDGYFAIKDGKTAPGAISGLAILYVDAADGDLKIKFGDGVTKTLATDT